MISKIKTLLGIVIAATLPVSGVFALSCSISSGFFRETLLRRPIFYSYILSLVLFIGVIIIRKMKINRIVIWLMLFTILFLVIFHLFGTTAFAQDRYFDYPGQNGLCGGTVDSTKQIFNELFGIPFWIVNSISLCLLLYKLKKNNEDAKIK